MEESETLLSEPLKSSWVYVLRREGHASMCKVGFTSVSAKSRALAYTDGEWLVFAEYAMPNWLAKEVENEVHVQLANHWLDPKLNGGSAREVFLCEPSLAEIAITIAHEKRSVEAAVLLGFSLEIAQEILLKKKPNSQVLPAFHVREQSIRKLEASLTLADAENYRLSTCLKRSDEALLQNRMKNSDLKRINQVQKLRIDVLEKTIVAFYKAANAEFLPTLKSRQDTASTLTEYSSPDVSSQPEKIRPEPYPSLYTLYNQSLKPAQPRAILKSTVGFFGSLFRGLFVKKID